MPRMRAATAGGGLPEGRPQDARLVDRFGRVATDLRVSLTDKCNLRCSYCMPAEGLDWMADDRLLTDDEIVRLITVAVDRLGVDEVRFTGGEPLLRKGLEKVVAATTALRTADGRVPETALTTNGLGLTRRAAALAAAGLARVNVSLDTLIRERFAAITHRDRLDDVLAGARAATAAGLGPVKVNAVLLRGVNDDEAPALLRWALAEGYQLRFIEQMPLDPQGAWDRTAMITAEEILAALEPHFELRHDDPSTRGAAPAETWHVTDGEHLGVVGIIASVTRPFCGDCDRTRLTADGQIRDCLFATSETDLRGMLRDGATDEQLADVWRTAMWGKRAGHGIDDPGFLHPSRPMSAIGG
jgi:cyclic pyranopterin phosphate synthase